MGPRLLEARRSPAAGSASSSALGSSPAAFHARVLPKWTRMFARPQRALPKAVKAGAARNVNFTYNSSPGLRSRRVRLEKSGMLPQRVQGGHEGIPLFASLAWRNVVHGARDVVEDVGIRLSVKRGHEGGQRHAGPVLQNAQHAYAR